MKVPVVESSLLVSRKYMERTSSSITLQSPLVDR